MFLISRSAQIFCLNALKSSTFTKRHIGPSPKDVQKMLETVKVKDLDQLVKNVVPADILLNRKLNIPTGLSEFEALREAERISKMNTVGRSFIGMGYHNCNIPTTIIRNVLENPGWYTAYTPYQAEISQGRLEALFIFQTVVSDLTGLPIANASLLDEGTAVAEAMGMAYRITKRKNFFVDQFIHPQTLSVVNTRARLFGWNVQIGNLLTDSISDNTAAVVFQYPNTFGNIIDHSSVILKAKQQNIMSICATDLLSLSLIKPPGEFGVDIAVGSSQRLGQPVGFGGPHAAFIACRKEHVRNIPGRIVGQTVTNDGEKSYRLALQTREQHIRRQTATSNICTAQALLANLCSFYCVYHGKEGLESLAKRANANARYLGNQLSKNGYKIMYNDYFDTITVKGGEGIRQKAEDRSINLRYLEQGYVVVSLDETVTHGDMASLCEIFGVGFEVNEWLNTPFSIKHRRNTKFLTDQIFRDYQSETEFMRFVKKMENKDISLVHSMITLGSCTMKLNSATSLEPLSWPGFTSLHPFLPSEQTLGYAEVFQKLNQYLCEITGFDQFSFQPNSGAQGEYAGLIAIVRYLESKGETQRKICLIPTNAHGTNPATGVMAGLDVKSVELDSEGGININQLEELCNKYKDEIACLMVTYPSTFGFFDKSIVKICQLVHSAGGQVYLDGANMNAQVGLCRPGDYGADVCHLNMHKTFAIPHGGGGPGAGPIGVRAHLAPFLPGDPLNGEFSVSSSNFGSASILMVSYMYIKMMGERGLSEASKIAILNANYLKARLDPYYRIIFLGENGFCAHEFIINLEEFTKSAKVDPIDVAKRLMDYGYHAPTTSFPLKNVLMIEPTESESLIELDRFCDAMISIRGEIADIENGRMDPKFNPLKMSPHTVQAVCSSHWDRPYSRETAAFPSKLISPSNKVWPSVGRINEVHGDRNLICKITGSN